MRVRTLLLVIWAFWAASAQDAGDAPVSPEHRFFDNAIPHMDVTPNVVTPNAPLGPEQPEFQALQADFPTIPPADEGESAFPDGPRPITDLTEKPPQGPSGRWLHTMVRIQDRVYIWGGISSFTKKFFNDMWLFNTVEETWEQLQSAHIPPLPDNMGRAPVPLGGKPYDGGVPAGAPQPPGVQSVPPGPKETMDPPAGGAAPPADGDGASLLQRYFRRRNRRGYRHVALEPVGVSSLPSFLETLIRVRDDDAPENPDEAADPNNMDAGPKDVQPDNGDSIKGKPISFELSDPFMFDDFWYYDLNLREWKMLPAQVGPVPRYLHTAVVIGEKMVIFGGVSRNKVVLSDCWVYDTVTEKWVEAKPKEMVLPRQAHTAVAINKKMYIFGGVSYGYFPFSDVLEYDPKKNKWKKYTFTDGPCERFHHTAIAYENKKKKAADMYVFGGVDAKLIPLDDLWKYDTKAKSWEKLEAREPRPYPRMMHTMTLVNTTIYLLFGIANNVPHEDMWKWEIGGDDPAWTEFNPTTAFPFARQGAKSITIYNDAPVAGKKGERISDPPPFNKPTAEPSTPRHFQAGPKEVDKNGGHWFKFPFAARPQRYRKDYRKTAYILSFGGSGPVPKSTVDEKLGVNLQSQGTNGAEGEGVTPPGADGGESFFETAQRRRSRGPGRRVRARGPRAPAYSSDAAYTRSANRPRL